MKNILKLKVFAILIALITNSVQAQNAGFAIDENRFVGEMQNIANNQLKYSAAYDASNNGIVVGQENLDDTPKDKDTEGFIFNSNNNSTQNIEDPLDGSLDHYSASMAVSDDGSISVLHGDVAENKLSFGAFFDGQNYIANPGHATSNAHLEFRTLFFDVDSSGQRAAGMKFPGGSFTPTAIIVNQNDIENPIDLNPLTGDDSSIAFGIASNGRAAVGKSGSGFSEKVYSGTTVNKATTHSFRDNKSELDLTSRAVRYDLNNDGSLASSKDLGVLQDGELSAAYAISNNGVTVGESTINTASTIENTLIAHAFKHTDAEGMTSLGTLASNDATANSKAYDISADGTIIVGSSENDASDTRAFIYFDGEMRDLGTLGGDNAIAYGISSDGTTIVGQSEKANGQINAFMTKITNIGNNVGIEDTMNSLAINSARLQSLITSASRSIYANLDQDETLFGENNIGVSIGTRHSRLTGGGNAKTFGSSITASGDDYNFNQSAATLRISYRFNDNYRAGIFADQSFSDNLPGNYNLQNATPLYGAFVTYTQNLDETGWRARLVAQTNTDSLTITRGQVGTSESGRGKTRMNSRGFMGEIAYGKKINNDWLLQPYVGLRRIKIGIKGYTEYDDVDFPISYSAVNYRATTLILGAKFSRLIADKTRFNIGGGVERTLSASASGHRATNSTGVFSGYHNNNDLLSKSDTLPFASVGLSYDLKKNHRVGSDLYYIKLANGGQSFQQLRLYYTIGF